MRISIPSRRRSGPRSRSRFEASRTAAVATAMTRGSRSRRARARNWCTAATVRAIESSRSTPGRPLPSRVWTRFSSSTSNPIPGPSRATRRRTALEPSSTKATTSLATDSDATRPVPPGATTPPREHRPRVRRRPGANHYIYITQISTESYTVAQTLVSRNDSATVSTQRNPVVSISSHFQGAGPPDAAAFHLSQFAQGILAGELAVLAGHEAVPVQPTEFLVREVEVTRKPRADHLSGRVSWPRRSSRQSRDPPGDPGPHRAGGALRVTYILLRRHPGATPGRETLRQMRTVGETSE